MGNDKRGLVMAITKYDTDYKAVRRKIITFSGTVKVEDVLAARVVHLFKEQTGKLVESIQSNPSTGAWSIEVCDNTNVKYFAVCAALSNSRNNEVIGHVTGL